MFLLLAPPHLTAAFKQTSPQHYTDFVNPEKLGAQTGHINSAGVLPLPFEFDTFHTILPPQHKALSLQSIVSV